MAKYKGEIAVQASVNGRRITLDPLREKVLSIAAREVESTIPCGMCINWVAGEREGTDFDLSVGAGCGEPWLGFNYAGRSYCINVVDILEALFAFADEGVS